MQPNTSLSRFLPYQLSIASNAVSGRIAQEYRARFGLSIPEWRVMAILGDSGAMTQRELTRRTLMDKVAVNRACKVLEDRGLAARTPNEQDGRSHLLALSDQGKGMFEDIMPLAVEMEQRLFEGFSIEEMSLFRGMLEKVRRQVDGMSDDEDEDRDFGVS